MKKYIFLLSALAIAPFLTANAQEATVTESRITMKTYPFGDPNPIAKPENSFYPYFRFDGFADKGVQHTWKTVVLENPYIRVTMFPEIGGKVWSALDKTTGKDFIYHNHVAKFRDIAMRGAWVSGGIEFNFGIIGHAPTSASPVDYTVMRKPDGSVSCFVSSYELITRTQWTVEVNLPKDKAYFTTHTTWHNGSSLNQPYYQWMNAAYKASDDMQFCYPGNHHIFHDGQSYSFPIDEAGRDISWYRNNNFESSKSYHVLGYYNDFYGAYWHDKNFGSVHYASPDNKLGMKIFLWSQAADGGIWEDLLTDADGQYVEMQSGRMYNQPAPNSAYTPFKHSSFTPQGTDEWTEYWYPVEGTKGLTKASPIGALNFIRKDGQLTLYFSPVVSGNKELRITDGDKTLFTRELSLTPLKTWTETFALKGVPGADKIKVTIGNDELVYSEDIKTRVNDRPLISPNSFDWNSAYGLYVKGEQWMNTKLYEDAERDLRASLKKEPYFVPALVRLATLMNHTGQYEDAAGLSRTAMSIDTYDGEANYANGFANKQLGNSTFAKDAFSVASYNQSFRSAAYAQLASLFIAEKNYARALTFCDKSIEYNVKNYDALQEKLICYRNMNRKQEACQLIDEILKENPLLHGIRFEKYLLNPSESSWKDFQSMIRNELPDETYEELALWYADKKCDDEALTLCSMTADDPTADYIRAYLLKGETDKSKSDAALSEAVSRSPKMVFPFRPEMIRIYAWADSVKPAWQTKYYEALTLAANLNKGKALELLNQCDDAAYAPLFVTRAAMKEGSASLADLRKAESKEQNWRTGDAIIKYYINAKDWKKADETAAKYCKKYPDNYIIGLKRGKTLCETGQYAKCIALLKSIKVMPNEGAYEGREVYREANLYQAIADISAGKNKQAHAAIAESKVWAENLGVGKPYEDQIDYRLENYLEALAAAGEARKSTDFYKSVADALKTKKDFSSNDLLSVVAMRKLGRQTEADGIVASWTEKNHDNMIAKWCAAVYKGDKTTADRLLKSRKTTGDLNIWDAAKVDRDFSLITKVNEVLGLR